MLLAAGTLVVAVEPAPALAASAQGTHTTQSSAQDGRQADPVVLAFGSGYGGGTDAARVRTLQRRLDHAGYSAGAIDGRFGPQTERAVKLFQGAHGLRVDGIAGPVTLAALRTPSDLLFPGAGYAGAGSGEVRSLQRLLRHDGYSPGPIDGRYGPRTERAVTGFQAAHALDVDGIAGPRTFGELERVAIMQRHATGSSPGSHLTAPSPLRRPSRPRTHSRPTTPPRPGLRLHPRPLRPTTRQAARPGAAARRRGGGTNRPGGPLWPWLLVPAGLIGVAAFATRVWLIDRRRRELVIATLQPPGADTAPVAVGEVEVGSEPARPTNDANGATGSVESGESGHVTGLGVRLEGRGDEAAAELAYRYADQRGDAVAASNLGVLLERRGDLVGAEAAYRRADERGDVNGAFNLAGLLVARGDAEGAMAAYSRADRRGDAGAAANLALLLLERGDVAGARDAYRRSDQRGDGGAAANLGVLLERDGDLPGAEAAYRRADERGDVNGAFNLGGLLADKGDLPGATAAYRRAAEGGDPTAAFTLGVLLERQDNPHGALRAYKRAQASTHQEIADMARARAHALSRVEGGER